MTIDVYSHSGQKKSSLSLPVSLFGQEQNEGLMHQLLIMQQSNRRHPIAHAKNRGEVQGSTRKLFQQKGTGRARRGSVRSPLLRGGGKAFGPRSNQNYEKRMPKEMRHRALRSCLAYAAEHASILGLESYPDTIKTKEVLAMLEKMPITMGRKTIVITDGLHNSLQRSVRNIPNVKTLRVQYLNPEDLLGAHAVIFLTDALKAAETLFGAKKEAKAEPKKAAAAKEDTPAAS